MKSDSTQRKSAVANAKIRSERQRPGGPGSVLQPPLFIVIIYVFIVCLFIWTIKFTAASGSHWVEFMNPRSEN